MMVEAPLHLQEQSTLWCHSVCQLHQRDACFVEVFDEGVDDFPFFLCTAGHICTPEVLQPPAHLRRGLIVQVLQDLNSHFHVPNFPSAEKELAVEVQDVLSIYISKHQVYIHMDMKKISFLIPQCAHDVVSNVALNKKYFRIAFVLKFQSLSKILSQLNPRLAEERFLFTYCNLLYFFRYIMR